MSRDSVWVHLVTDTLADTTYAYRLPQDATQIQVATLARQVQRLENSVAGIFVILLLVTVALAILNRRR